MSKKTNLWQDATSQWKGASGKTTPPKGAAGSYDRNGKLIEGTQPKPPPPKPTKGSYDRRGKLIKSMTGQSK